MASPASSARPTSSRCSDTSTSRPSPPAPMSAAMTTMPSAAMIVWLTPAMIVGMASGICTLKSVCRAVEPKLCAASTAAGATSRMPRLVKRMAGGRAKITVATTAGTRATPKKSSTGMR